MATQESELSYKETMLNIIRSSKQKERHPETGLFPLRYKLQNHNPTIILDICYAFKIKEKMHAILNQVAGIHLLYYNEEHDIWDIDFGTKPIEKTFDPYDKELHKIVNRKKWVATVIANKMLEKYEYFHNNLYDYYYNKPEFRELKWFTAAVSITYDILQNKITVDFIRLDGDYFTFYIIKNEIEKGLK